MSPEIIRGDNGVKGEADYWALGVILYLVYTKKCPFDSSTVHGIFDNVIEYNINWNLLESNKLDPNLLKIIKGLLEYDPKSRICSLSQIKASAFFDGNILIYIYITIYKLCYFLIKIFL